MAETRSKGGGKSSPNPKKKGKKAAGKPKEAEAVAVQEPSEVEKLKAQIAMLEKQKTQVKASTKSKADLTAEERRWQNDVTVAYTKFIFGQVKFIFCQKKLTGVCKKLLEKWNLKEFDGLTGQALVKAQAEWIENNRNLVRQAYLHCHNYSQSQLRTFITDQLITGEKIPTPKQVLLCAMRDKSMMEEENQWIFDMYVDVLLLKCMTKQHWDTKFRHYNTVSKAKLGDSDDAKYCITTGSEAYLATLYYNCYKRWVYIADCNKNKTKVDRTNPASKTPFISADKGQNPFGGWNVAGKEYFDKRVKEISEAREQDHVEEMEEQCLKRLRIKHGIEDANGKMPAKKSKKRKAIDEEVEEDMTDLDF